MEEIKHKPTIEEINSQIELLRNNKRIQPAVKQRQLAKLYAQLKKCEDHEFALAVQCIDDAQNVFELNNIVAQMRKNGVPESKYVHKYEIKKVELDRIQEEYNMFQKDIDGKLNAICENPSSLSYETVSVILSTIYEYCKTNNYPVPQKYIYENVMNECAQKANSLLINRYHTLYSEYLKRGDIGLFYKLKEIDKQIRRFQKDYTFLPAFQPLIYFQHLDSLEPTKPFEPVPAKEFRIKWSDVIFKDGYVKLGKFGHQDCTYSKRSFNALTNFFNSINLPDIIVLVSDMGEVEVKNLDLLQTIITILSVKDDMETIYNQHIARRDIVLSLIEKFNSINIKYWKYLYKGADFKYLNFILDNKSAQHKIVPVREVVKSKGYYREDDGFLIPVMKGQRLYIVWESLNFGKATYIFQTDTATIDSDIQKIFNYLVSEQENKRTTLFSTPSLRQRYGYLGRCFHTGYNMDNWLADYRHLVK